jgi:hypothetical protein
MPVHPMKFKRASPHAKMKIKVLEDGRGYEDFCPPSCRALLIEMFLIVEG